MTRERERLIEIMNDEINASEFRVTSDVLGRSADGILAEMAGEWNEALDLAAHVADVQSTDAGNDQWEMGAAQIAKDIRALRRPDAAPEARLSLIHI